MAQEVASEVAQSQSLRCGNVHLISCAPAEANMHQTKCLKSKWTHWDLNPGPSACEADVIPLHHVPDWKAMVNTRDASVMHQSGCVHDRAVIAGCHGL